jgi:flagellar basal body-associated protein FliL
LVASAQKDKTSGRVAGVSTTVLMIATVVLLLALAGAAIAAWLITRQPAEQPLDLPSVARAQLGHTVSLEDRQLHGNRE